MKHFRIRLGRTLGDERIEVDGVELDNVVSVIVTGAVNELPTVTLTVHPETIELEAEAEGDP